MVYISNQIGTYKCDFPQIQVCAKIEMHWLCTHISVSVGICTHCFGLG